MEELYQFNTLGSLMSGFYDGQKTISNLRRHGSFGIGTFDQVEGEMIVLDGIVYQALGESSVRIADHNQTTPYAALTDHQADVLFEITDEHSLEEVEGKLERHLISLNLFHSIKVYGLFEEIRVRVATKTASGTSFDIVAAHQSEYSARQILGTIVGFWTPAMYNGMSLGGFHLHFISDDKKIAGHIVDFNAKNLTAEIGQISKIQQEFPVDDESFLRNEINFQKVSEIIDIAE
jgi:acetolactate decarboxylase